MFEHLSRTEPRKLPDGLYLAAIPLASGGTCHLTLEDAAAHIVAQRDFVVPKVPKTYWATFATLQSGVSRDYFWAARPQIPGFQPLDLAALEKTAPQDAPDLFRSSLPGTLPCDPRWLNPAPWPKNLPATPLQLTLDNGQFVIKAGGRQLIDWPDWHLLARWWVNGQPVEAPRPIQPHARQAARQVTATATFRIAFGYPDALGSVKSGDKLALQLMYAPEFEELAADAQTAGHISIVDHQLATPLLSNKLEFTLTPQLLAARAASTATQPNISPTTAPTTNPVLGGVQLPKVTYTEVSTMVAIPDGGLLLIGGGGPHSFQLRRLLPDSDNTTPRRHPPRPRPPRPNTPPRQVSPHRPIHPHLRHPRPRFENRPHPLRLANTLQSSRRPRLRSLPRRRHPRWPTSPPRRNPMPIRQQRRRDRLPNRFPHGPATPRRPANHPNPQRPRLSTPPASPSAASSSTNSMARASPTSPSPSPSPTTSKPPSPPPPAPTVPSNFPISRPALRIITIVMTASR